MKDQRFSRRHVLVLAGAVLLAGCQPAPSKPNSPTRTYQLISPQNARQVKQVDLVEPKIGVIQGVSWPRNSKTGPILAIGGEKTVWIWNVEQRKRVVALKGPTDTVSGLSWSPDDSRLAGSCRDGTLYTWRADNWQQTAYKQHGEASQLLSVAWSPDGSKLAAGDADGKVHVWDVQTSQELIQWTASGSGPLGDAEGPFPLGVWGVSWSPDNKSIASGRYDGLGYVWDPQNRKLLSTIHPDDRPNGFAWSPDGHLLAGTTDSGATMLWDAATWKSIATMKDEHATTNGWSYGICWSPDGSMLATSYQTGEVRLWDARKHVLLTTLTGHTTRAWTVDWSHDGKLVASGSYDETVRLWGVQ